MMQKLRDPKNVKMISLFVAAIFVLGCFALTLTQVVLTAWHQLLPVNRLLVLSIIRCCFLKCLICRMYRQV